VVKSILFIVLDIRDYVSIGVIVSEVIIGSFFPHRNNS
jgi:hypothetical protein